MRFGLPVFWLRRWRGSKGFSNRRRRHLWPDGQVTPDGYYNIERMVRRTAKAAKSGCAVPADARGIKEDLITQGAHRSSMEELTN